MILIILCCMISVLLLLISVILRVASKDSKKIEKLISFFAVKNYNYYGNTTNLSYEPLYLCAIFWPITLFIAIFYLIIVKIIILKSAKLLVDFAESFEIEKRND